MEIKGYYQDRTVFIDDKELLPVSSQKLKNHSPDGFSWGYDGSGPAQLALAILLEITKDEDFSLKKYQDFKRDIICDLPVEKNFAIDGKQVLEWIEKRKTKSKQG